MNNNRNAIVTVIVIIILLIIGIWVYRGTRNDIPSETATTTASNITTLRPYGRVTLGLGESAAFKGITITPLSIAEDSRCPEKVQCIQAGTVRVNVSSLLDTATAPRQDIVKLNATSTIDTFAVTLVSVDPTKKSGSQIADKDYKLTFEVHQAPVTDRELMGK